MYVHVFFCYAYGFTGRVPPQDVLASLCVSMSITMLILSSAVDDIIAFINKMNARSVTATARCAVDYDTLLSTLANIRACVLRKSRACSRAYDKWLDEKAEEADTVSKQLAAVSVMCAVQSMYASALLHSVGHMSMLAQSMAGDGARLLVPVSTLTSSALAGISTACILSEG